MWQGRKGLIIVIALWFADFCSANPVVVGPSFPDVPVGHALTINLVVDFMVLAVAFVFIKKPQLLATWMFVPYFLMVYIAGVIIDVIALVPVFFSSLLGVGVIGGVVYFLTAAFFLYLYNSFLAKRYYHLTISQAAIVGLSLAFLTNPILGWLFFGGSF